MATTQTSSYRDVKAVSNSLMTLYEGDFGRFVSYWVRGIPYGEKKEEYLTLGSAVDTLLTRPSEFDDMFIVFNALAPTGQMLSFCQSLYEISVPNGLAIEQCFEEAYLTVGFKRDSLAKVIERFAEFRPYYDFLVDSNGKSVLTLEMASKAHLIVQELKENKYTAPIVNVTSKKNSKVHIEVLDQLEIFGDFKTNIDDKEVVIPIKGAVDRVIIDHKKKKIYPIDFKSSYDVGSFEYSYAKYNYFRQGSFYTYLIDSWKKTVTERLGVDISDYTVAPFLFVVCSTSGGVHYTYRMTPKEITKAREGGTRKDGRVIKGWTDILLEIAYLQNEGSWSYPYQALLNNGIIPLDVFQEDPPPPIVPKEPTPVRIIADRQCGINIINDGNNTFTITKTPYAY